MRYGHPYMQTRVADGLIDFALDHREPMKDGQISGQSTVTRSSKIAFIKDRRVLEPFMKLAQDVNKGVGGIFISMRLNQCSTVSITLVTNMDGMLINTVNHIRTDEFASLVFQSF